MQCDDSQVDDEPDADILEQRHFQHVVDTFLFYRTHSLRQVERKVKSFNSIPQHHQKMLPSLVKRLHDTKDAVEVNYTFIEKIVQATEHMFSNSSVSAVHNERNRAPITGDDVDRVRTTLKQFVRDWSVEGAEERNKCYAPICKELDSLYPSDSCDREIAAQGFTCQGNEFSLYMLFASHFILNVCEQPESESIYPWLHNGCNVVTNNDQLREVRIPDITPQLTSTYGFSMAAGDFLDIYTEIEAWDCVAMCFFLDTAHNLWNT